MLPFTQAVVPEVDTRAGRIVVEPPPGTFVDQPTPRDGARASARRGRTRKRKVRLAPKRPRSPRLACTRDDNVGS